MRAGTGNVHVGVASSWPLASLVLVRIHLPRVVHPEVPAVAWKRKLQKLHLVLLPFLVGVLVSRHGGQTSGRTAEITSRGTRLPHGARSDSLACLHTAGAGRERDCELLPRARGSKRNSHILMLLTSGGRRSRRVRVGVRSMAGHGYGSNHDDKYQENVTFIQKSTHMHIVMKRSTGTHSVNAFKAFRVLNGHLQHLLHAMVAGVGWEVDPIEAKEQGGGERGTGREGNSICNACNFVPRLPPPTRNECT